MVLLNAMWQPLQTGELTRAIDFVAGRIIRYVILCL